MRNFGEFLKEAKTRVQKMIDSGAIKDKKILDRIYDVKPEITDNIHTRINARAKRAADAAKNRVVKNSADIRHRIRDAKGAISDLAGKRDIAKRRLNQYDEQKKLYSKAFSGDTRKQLLSDTDSAARPHKERYADLIARIKNKATELKESRRALNKSTADAVKRSSLADVTSKPMTAARYKKLSNINGLKSTPAIDTNRQLKQGGRANAKVIGEARGRLGQSKVRVDHDMDLSSGRHLEKDQALMMDVEDGVTHSRRHSGDRSLAGVNIMLPYKKSTTIDMGSKGLRQLPPRLAREHRGKTAFHEISGELRELMDRESVMDRYGIAKSDSALELGATGTHQTPFVLKRDAEFSKRLSPATTRRSNRLRKMLGESDEMNHLMLGDGATKQQIEMPFSENIKDHWNPVKVLTERAKRQGYNTSNPLLQDMIKSMSHKK